MIYVFMRGRLGNQLFQYAFSRSLQLNNPNQKIVYIFNDVYSSGNQEDGWENSLKYFKTIGVKEVTSIKVNLNVIQKIIMKLYWSRFPHNTDIDTIHKYQFKWLHILNKSGLYYLDLGYYPFNKKIKKNVIVSGNFESPLYFEDIKDIIKNEIVPIKNVLEKNIKLLKLIQSTNSVCISIRRGDFVSDKKYNYLNICNMEYFYKAEEIIKKEIINPVFFIFSDDIEWCKKNLKFSIKSYYESGNDPVWEKLRLMYSCKHFILSNSTFSWWAQYLSTNKEKVVIAPKKWYDAEFQTALLDDEWIKI